MARKGRAKDKASGDLSTRSGKNNLAFYLISRFIVALPVAARMDASPSCGKNGSGDYVIALSVAPGNLINDKDKLLTTTVLANGEMSSIFAATIEAIAEALWNSLFMADSMTGRNGKHVDALPVARVLNMLRNR